MRTENIKNRAPQTGEQRSEQETRAALLPGFASTRDKLGLLPTGQRSLALPARITWTFAG